MAKLVSKTYGEAMFELAVEQGSLDTTEEEIKGIKQVLLENTDLMKLLNHPKIAKDEKVSIIENIFKGRVSDTTVGFLVIIVEKDRYNELQAVFDYFLARVKEYKNMGTAVVTSAMPLSGVQKEQVEKKLLATTAYSAFEMDYRVDAALIGGMVIRIGDRVVDGSVRTKLAVMAKELSA